jgi:4-amino-4-deoxy-L-arabinose transferase-like glycosyltransferase
LTAAVDSRKQALAWVLLFLVWFGIGIDRPLLEPDEGRYAEIPREMWVSGDWVTPHLNDVTYLEKPPLQYWVTAAAYAVFGPHEWTARLFSLIAGFLALPLVGWLAGTLHRSMQVGTAASVVLATSPYFLLVTQLNVLDGGFSTLLSIALFAFVVAQLAEDDRRARGPMLIVWATLALALLTKGLAALLLPGGTLVVYSLVSRDFSPWRRLHLATGIPVFAVIAVPWFVFVSRENPGFLWFFFVHEHFERFLTTIHRRVEPWWYFGPILLVGVLPWIGTLIPAVRRAWSEPGERSAFRPQRFLLIWCVLVFIFFSASGSKLATYILPCMPALAVLLAPVIAARPKTMTVAAVVTFALVLVTAIALVVIADRRAGEEPVHAALYLWSSVAALAAGGALLWHTRRSRVPQGDRVSLAPIALGTAAAWIALLHAYTYVPPMRSAELLVDAVRESIGPQTKLYSVGQYRQSVPFYLGRTLRMAAYEGELEYALDPTRKEDLPTLEAFAAAWPQEQDAVAFVDPQDYVHLEELGVPGRVIARDGRSVVLARQ